MSMEEVARVGVRRTIAGPEYEGHWGCVHQGCQAAFANGETNLARLLLAGERMLHQRQNAAKLAAEVKKYGMMMNGKRFTPDHPESAIVFGMIATYMARRIVSLIPEGTVQIVEMGSGYGRNLINIWHHGGPQNARYLGLEYTNAGRATANFLSAVEPGIDLKSVPFDYHAPNFSMLDPNLPTVAFSINSIEQAPVLGDPIFESLLSIPGLQCVIHFEPISWQMTDVLPDDPVINQNAKAWSQERAYNTDLWPQLRRYEKERRLTISRSVRYDHAPYGFHPNAMILWSPIHHGGPVGEA